MMHYWLALQSANSLRDLLVAGGMFLLVLLTLLVLRKSLEQFWQWRERQTPDGSLPKMLAEATTATRWLFIFVLAAGAGFSALNVPAEGQRDPMEWVHKFVVVAILIQSLLWINVLIHEWFDHYQKKRLETDAASVTTLAMMIFLGRLLLYAVVGLMMLDNLGLRVGPLLASLGVAGIAVGLAAQSILSDLFASLSIVLDRPFVIGDFIIVDDKLGTVEHIGLKTTRVRSLDGEQLVLSNGDLLKSRIRNFKRMAERRVVFAFTLLTNTPPSAVRTVPPAVKEIIEQIQHARFDRAHFKSIADSGLLFEVVYYVLSSDYNLYMDIQQRINLELLEFLEQEGLELAYPTQSLFLQQTSPWAISAQAQHD